MKKFLVIPIMFLYLLAVSGVVIHVHYCGKMMESWSLFAKNKGCTDDGCKKEKEQSDGCCKDKVITSSISQDQHAVAAIQLKFSNIIFDIAALHSYPTVEHLPHCYEVKVVGNQPNAPPGRWQQIPLYKLHSRIIYYG